MIGLFRTNIVDFMLFCHLECNETPDMMRESINFMSDLRNYDDDPQI